MKKLNFSKVLSIWFCVAFILNLVNGYLIKSSFLYSLIIASLGMLLLIYPVYPEGLELRYSKSKCKKIVRVIAVLQIVLSFLVRTTF